MIERLEIDAPAARVVRTSHGIVGRGVTTKDALPAANGQQIFEMFELRKLRLDGGSVVYEDRVTPGAVPLVWHDFTVDLNTASQAGGEYGYQFSAGDGKVTSLSAEGSLNIDDLVLRMSKCSLRATVDPKASDSPLPGESTALRALRRRRRSIADRGRRGAAERAVAGEGDDDAGADRVDGKASWRRRAAR